MCKLDNFVDNRCRVILYLYGSLKETYVRTSAVVIHVVEVNGISLERKIKY